VRWVVRIRRTEDRGIAERSSSTELRRPRQAARGAEQLWIGWLDDLLCAQQPRLELLTAIGECGTAVEIVVAYLVSAGSNRSHDLRMGCRALPDEEEGRARLLLDQKGENCGSADWAWTVVERQRHDGLAGRHAPDNGGSDALQKGEERERFRPPDNLNAEESAQQHEADA
jgi:hypothetical protein